MCQDTNSKYFGEGGSGGGIQGGNGTSEYDPENIGYGGTQTEGGSSKIEAGSFGQGGHASTSAESRGGGGGGGYYGGGSGRRYGAAGGGGSGYIANTNLYDKYMTCYNCSPSDEVQTKTLSNTCISLSPMPNCSKANSGYAKISFID